MFNNLYHFNKFYLRKKKKQKLQEEKNKLKIKLTNIMNKIYLTKEKKFLNKSQLHLIRQLLKIITKRKYKNILDNTDKNKLAEIINIINKKEVKNLLLSKYINSKEKNNNKEESSEIINQNKLTKKKNNEDEDDSYSTNNYISKKIVLFYLKKLNTVKFFDDSIKYKNYDLALKDRNLVYVDLQNSIKYLIQKLYFFWFPLLQINKLLTLKTQDIDNWKIYVFLNIPEKIEDIKHTYYKFYKREHIYKIIIAGPWYFSKYIHRYSRPLIIYSKRLLCYYKIIVDSLQGYKYNRIEINLNEVPYKNTLFSRNLFWIFLDIKLCLMHGYYNKHIMVSLAQLEETSLEIQDINKETLDQIQFNKEHINLILLTEKMPFNYFWI